MKIRTYELKKHIRICFGFHDSLTINNLTVQETLNFCKNIFGRIKLNTSLQLTDHCPLNKFETNNNIRLTVYEEAGVTKSRIGSKTKTLYGITGKQAYEIFLQEFKSKYPEAEINPTNKPDRTPTVHINFGGTTLVIENSSLIELQDLFYKIVTNTKFVGDPTAKMLFETREYDNGFKDSKSKTYYGISPLTAKKLFLENYKKYLP